VSVLREGVVSVAYVVYTGSRTDDSVEFRVDDER
jgi:hypothetical protein